MYQVYILFLSSNNCPHGMGGGWRRGRVHNFYKPDNPLPWDENFKPKRAVAAIRDALLQTPRSTNGENG